MPSLQQLIKYIPSKKIPIGKLTFDENNPNKMSPQQMAGLEKFMLQHGFAVEIWVNKNPDGKYMVIDGEHRVKLLIKHKIPHVYAKVFSVSYSEIRIMRQIANKLAGVHDEKKDALEFKHIFDDGKLDEFAEFLAQDKEDFEKVLEKNFNYPIERPEEQDIPAPPQVPKTKLNDVYLLGPHKLLCGDALNSDNIAKLLNSAKPRMVYTDPPYGLGGYKGRSTKFEPIKGDDGDVTKYYEAIPADIPERYIWGTWKVLSQSNLTPRDVIVWKKNNFGMGRGYRNQYEICMYFGEFAGSDSDVWDHDKDAVTEYNHPTQKPISLATRAIKNSTKTGDAVLDIYAGSGSTLLSCEQTNRVFYGMELDPGYVDVIVQRWENFTGDKATLVSSKN